jgi:hypothetical protein
VVEEDQRRDQTKKEVRGIFSKGLDLTLLSLKMEKGVSEIRNRGHI